MPCKVEGGVAAHALDGKAPRRHQNIFISFRCAKGLNSRVTKHSSCQRTPPPVGPMLLGPEGHWASHPEHSYAGKCPCIQCIPGLLSRIRAVGETQQRNGYLAQQRVPLQIYYRRRQHFIARLFVQNCRQDHTPVASQSTKMVYFPRLLGEATPHNPFRKLRFPISCMIPPPADRTLAPRCTENVRKYNFKQGS